MTETVPPDPSAAEPEFLLGRLFVVPLIILAVILSCAMIVVLSFGAIASDKEKPLTQVLALLEAGTGEKTAGLILAPQDKEMWQAAQELALRLERLETEVTPEELPEIQARLVKLLERDLSAAGARERVGRQRTYFVMRAAARAGASAVVPLLLEALDSPDADIRREALGALALMPDSDAAAAQVDRISRSLGDSEPVVRMVACAALSKLADSTDDEVIGALSGAHLTDEDQDVRWNAALTLARLGSPKALPTIAEMLQRSHWQNQRVQFQSSEGTIVDRPMGAERVNEYLVTAIEAAVNVDDVVIWDLIDDLTNDPALRVVGRARQAIADRAVSGHLAPDAGAEQ
jgi:HEAT repeat protein